MWHFTSIKTQIKNRDALVKALADVGFARVEVHETGQPLYGFQGDVRPEKAEVIVRRQYLGAASNDMGFKQQKDGQFEAIISAYDRAYRYSRQWLNELTQRYGYHALMATVPEQGFAVEEEETLEDGTIRVVLGKWV